ncbi:MAG: hypothetical protein HY644_13285 [Acidobacteria bacterium]|nr:hypothetical protein [Acidobacteriota bacterium]
MTKSDLADRIEAEVILRPASGGAELPPIPTAENIRQFEAAPHVVDEISAKLRAMGFVVTTVSPFTISISGPRVLFERVFRCKLTSGGETSAPLVLPEEIAEHVEQVYIQTPPIYFNQV